MVTADDINAAMKQIAAKYPKARDHLLGPRYSIVDYLRATDEQRAEWDAERAEAKRQADAFDAELRAWGAANIGAEVGDGR